jgi:hypothetical protein
MSHGYIYILFNKHVPKLVKIGYTERDPRTRAKELSGTTGVPGEWHVYESWPVNDAYRCEQRIFAALARKRETGEFFRLSPKVAVDEVTTLLAGWEIIGTDGLTDLMRERANIVRAEIAAKDTMRDWQAKKEACWKDASSQAERKFGKTLESINTQLGFFDYIFTTERLKETERQRNSLFAIRDDIFIRMRRDHFVRKGVTYPFNDADPV